MDYSNFIILLARQRSGTNALRSTLESHPDIFCFNEIFNLPGRESEDPLLREPNFFTFLKKYAQQDITRSFPDNHESLFLDYLEYLGCFSSKRHLLIDVKYNTTHFLSEPYKPIEDPPYLYKLIATHGLRVFNLTRKNYLRYAVSLLKARRSSHYTMTTSDAVGSDTRIHVDINFLMRLMNKCLEEDQLTQRFFSRHVAHYLACDYADVFPQFTGGGATAFLQRFSEWLGIDNCFTEQSHFKKQSYLPLEETIENYDEVAAVLRGTRFEYCLEDENMYNLPGGQA